jgi:micrococcal nuclease
MQASCPSLRPGPLLTVTRIIDGETLALDDGSELRLIGALAPRAIDAGADPAAWPMAVAAQAELQALALGKSIELGFGGARSDRYGRQQAHAFVIDQGRRRWLQGHMLEQGLARAFVEADNRACGAELLAAEQVARLARRGLWAEGAYQVRSADLPRELSRYRGTFQVVEGQVASVMQGRGSIYLNFGDGRRGAFAVSLRRGDRALLGSYAADPALLEGKLMRVRGWLEERSGPAINLSSAGLIEVLHDPAMSAISRAAGVER